MDYDKERVEFVYSCVLTGFSPFLLDGERFLVKHLCPKLLFEAHSVLMLSRDAYFKAGLPTEHFLLKDAESKGLWSPAKEKEIKDIENRILERSNLRDLAVLPSQKRTLEGEIRQLYEDKYKKQVYKQGLCCNSVESKLAADKQEYIVFASIFREDHTRLWAKFDDFQNEDEKRIKLIMAKYGESLEGINGSILRYIARTTDARTRFKNWSPVPSEASVFLLELSQWCSFYNSIYELSDKPHDNIIADDKRLDDWITARKAKQSVSVNNTDGGYTSFMGATKEDMDTLGGIDRKTALSKAAQDMK